MTRANDHIAFLTGLTGEKIQTFGKDLNDNSLLAEPIPHEEKKQNVNIPLVGLDSDNEPEIPNMPVEDDIEREPVKEEEKHPDTPVQKHVELKEAPQKFMPEIELNSKV